jgi:hypothetical protein
MRAYPLSIFPPTTALNISRAPPVAKRAMCTSKLNSPAAKKCTSKVSVTAARTDYRPILPMCKGLAPKSASPFYLNQKDDSHLSCPLQRPRTNPPNLRP